MNDATTKTKAKAQTSTADELKVEMPKFEIPKFEVPAFEVPAAFREFAEKGVSQAKDNWEKMKAATEEASDMLEDSYASASKGSTAYGLKMLEISRANVNAYFDFASELMALKSPSEVIELSTAHARKQFDAMTAQTRELTALAQKVAGESAEPLKNGFANAFKKVG